MKTTTKEAQKAKRKNKLVIGENKLHLMDSLFVQAFKRISELEATCNILETRQQALYDAIMKVTKKAEE